MDLLCLDLEGVLVPEIWEAIAQKTQIKELELTTRDVSDYDELMKLRLNLLDRNGITFSQITHVVEQLEPLPGAADFLEWAKQWFQVVVLSDTYYEFAMPLMKRLSYPFLLCHKLIVENDRITGYRLRQEDPKTAVVRGMHDLRLKVVAMGDSYNDIGMLTEADKGFLFRAPPQVIAEFPALKPVASYQEAKEQLKKYL